MNFQYFIKKVKEKNELIENSWLILGLDEEEKFKEILKLSSQISLNSDILIISKKEYLSEEISEKFSVLDLSIDSVRKAIRFLNLSPIGERKILIVNKAEELNIVSQNAFLKITEEPMKKSSLIFLVREENQLLPTLISRMKKLNYLVNTKEYFKKRIKKEELEYFISPEKNREFLKEMFSRSDEEKIKFVENLAILERDNILNSLGIKENIFNLKEKGNYENIKKIFKYLPRLKHPAINHKLQLESLLFSIGK
jgi:DNA polymerase III delta prime subunit